MLTRIRRTWGRLEILRTLPAAKDAAGLHVLVVLTTGSLRARLDEIRGTDPCGPSDNQRLEPESPDSRAIGFEGSARNGLITP